MDKITELFSSMVFDDSVMKDRLSKDVYTSLKNTMELGSPLKLEIANQVATAMKNWAVEKGVTHFTHWFQPMTGITAEKHDSFISPTKDGQIIMDFSGKELIQGEPDASSFPNGGIRSTFEARGYTVWDTTSFAFIKDDILYIPTAFCSYSGEALDKKTPLLRSMEALNFQALRILKLFGEESVKRVNSTVGAEQEYFLIDREVFQKRPDLIHCGRTLFGAKPPKGQELDDHYFGAIKPKVSAFMKELDEELWKLGIMSKTRHNEVAPSQHELAPIFTVANIATDQNQTIMELMKSIADKHGLTCLLHEKPFAGINGSGKHNNWSLTTDTGINLFEAGDTPHKNILFILFLVSVLRAVNKHQDLIRISASSAGNDHRLGGNEAPPGIISIYLGEELTGILNAIENNKTYDGFEKNIMELGANVLPYFSKDTTDRNRSSPFAFTGNKFEFRMVGSAFSISGFNLILNTIISETLSDFADVLESCDNFNKTLHDLLQSTIIENKRIIFNGDNYSENWTKEAKKRGLLNLKTTVDALPYFISEENIKLFEKFKVLSENELKGRYEILMENYQKTIHIEALTFHEIVSKDIIEFSFNYQKDLLSLIKNKKELNIDNSIEEIIVEKCSNLTKEMYYQLYRLEEELLNSKNIVDTLDKSKFYREVIYLKMAEIRVIIDELETIVPKKYWKLPTYGEILYSVK